jgi:hypothetical protein
MKRIKELDLHSYGLAFFYSSFSAIGLLLVFMAHAMWFTTAKELGIPEVANVELTIPKALYLGFPYIILVFVSVFIIVYLSEHSERTYIYRQACPYPGVTFPLAISGSIFMGGIIGCYTIPLALNWVNVIISFLFSGIAGVSYFIHVYLMRMKKGLEELKGNVKDYRIFIKRLELEHNALQETLHWIMWTAIIFILSGVASVLIHGLEQLPSKLINIIILNASIVGIWGFLWIWFGIIAPISSHMCYMRSLLEELSLREDLKKKDMNGP